MKEIILEKHERVRALKRVVLEVEDIISALCAGHFIEYETLYNTAHDLELWSSLVMESLIGDKETTKIKDEEQ